MKQEREVQNNHFTRSDKLFRDSRKEPCSSSKKTSVSLGKTSVSSGKKVTVQNLSKKASSLFINLLASQIYDFLLTTLVVEFFQNLKIFFVHTRRLKL
jgi:hypothetical protein